MPWLNRFTEMFRSGDLDRDLDDELRSHIEMRTQDNLASGMSTKDARRDALLRFGNPTTTKEDTRSTRIITWLESLGRDLRYGLRQLRRSPGFAIVAVLTLALGIGANTAIFQLIDAVRLRSLPVDKPEQLMLIDLLQGNRAGNAFRTRSLTYPQYQQIRAQQQAFSAVMAWSSARFNLAEGGEMRFAEGLYVSGDFFQVLGVSPVVGRLFNSQDDTPACSAPGAVISYAFWQRDFAGSAEVLGRTVSLDGRRFPVVGVTPPSFFGVEVGTRYDVAIPLCADALLAPDGKGRIPVARDWWIAMMGRLKPDWTEERAGAHLQGISPGIMQATLPSGFQGGQAQLYLANKLTAVPAGVGISNLRQQYMQPLWLLLGITGLVLLIACANLANLLLARASARQREIAVRLAMGASRWRLIRQLFTEGLLLAISGAAFAALMADVLGRGLLAFLSTGSNSTFLALHTDTRVLGFTTAIAIGACIFFALLPAFRSTSVPPAAALHSGGRAMTAGPERFSLRRALVSAQVALSLVLLFGALLFVRSLRNLSTTDAGFQPQGVLSVTLHFPRNSYSREQVDVIRRELVERLSHQPGVVSAAQVRLTPLGGSTTDGQVGIDGGIAGGSGNPSNLNTVGPGYFRTMGTTLVAGRDFDDRDSFGAPKVAIVNEEFARRYFHGANPIGHTFRLALDAGKPEPVYQIVGLVQNTKYRSLREEFSPIAFFPISQSEEASGLGGLGTSFVLRVHGPMAETKRNVEKTVAEVNPAISIAFQVLTELINDSLLRERLMATLSGAFGLLAALLAALGLYGVISYMVAQRRNEIGIRMALGANRGRVILLVLREAVLLLAAGLAIGALLALWAGRAAGTLLFGIAPYDVVTMLGAALLLTVVALASSYLPARRAAALDPMVALRNE